MDDLEKRVGALEIAVKDLQDDVEELGIYPEAPVDEPKPVETPEA